MLWMIKRPDKLPIEINAYSPSGALSTAAKYYNRPLNDFSVYSYGYVDPKKMNRKNHRAKYL